MMVFGSQPWRGADTARERNLPRMQILLLLWTRLLQNLTYLQVNAEKPD